MRSAIKGKLRPLTGTSRLFLLSAGLSGALAACERAPVSPAGEGWRVYVTNEFSGNLTVIDGPSHRVVATVPLGKRPRGLSLSPDGRLLYIALSGSPVAGPGVDESKLPPADKSADGIGVFNTASLQMVRVLRGVSDPEQAAVTPDGRTLYVASEDTGTAVVINTAGAKLAEIAVGGEPEGVAVSPDGAVAYMTSEEDDVVAVIDTATRRLVRSVKVGARPRTVVFSPDGRRAYVSIENGAALTAIDAATGAVAGTATLTGENVRPMGVAVSPDARTVYVSTGRGGGLVSIDAATLRPLKSVAVGLRPWGVAVSPNGRFVYTANGPSNDISVVDASTMTVTARVPVGERPWGVLVGPAAAR